MVVTRLLHEVLYYNHVLLVVLHSVCYGIGYGYHGVKRNEVFGKVWKERREKVPASTSQLEIGIQSALLVE